MRTLLVALVLLLLPLAADATPPASPLPPPTEKIAPTGAAVDLHPGAMFRVPGRPETFIVGMDGQVAPATPEQVAAPTAGDHAVARTGQLAGLVALLTMVATWLLRRPQVVSDWLKDRPTLARLIPLGLAALATAGTSWLAGASPTDALMMVVGGGLGAIGTHQVVQGGAKTIQTKIDAKVAAARASQPPPAPSSAETLPPDGPSA